MREKFYRYLVLSSFSVIVFTVFLLFFYNLTINPDYSFHLHEAWAVFKGYFSVDPYLQSGFHCLFKYGYPVNILGAIFFPVFGKYSVAFLMSVSLVLLWFSSRKVFGEYVSDRKAKISAFLAVVNPLTISYAIAMTLPFLWGGVFAMFSIYFFLRKKNIYAIILAFLAVFTHPLAVFLLISLLLVEPDYTRWLKAYAVPFGVFFLQLSAFFGLFSSIFSGSGLLSFHPLRYFKLLVLPMALLIAYAVVEKTRLLSAVGMGALGGWCALGLTGFWIPVQYFDRLGYFVFLIITPFLFETILNKFEGKQLLIVPLIVGLALTGVLVQFLVVPEDNPGVYENENISGKIREIVENKYIHYGSDGAALYELPKLENLKFSNAGREYFSQPPDNKMSYLKGLRAENASYILVYGESSEGNLIRRLQFPRVYQEDNLKLYRVTTNLGS